MKHFIMTRLLIFFFICISGRLIAQTEHGSIAYDKQEVPCYITTVVVAPDIAEEAIKEQFKEMGKKAKEQKGFWEVKSISIAAIRKAPVDVYIKVEPKSKKEKDVSKIYLIVTEPGTGALYQQSGNGAEMEIGISGITAFMNSVRDCASDYKLALTIEVQEATIKQMEKKYNDLEDEERDTQKRLKKLQEAIKEQASELQKQKAMLTQMVNSRRR